MDHRGAEDVRGGKINDLDVADLKAIAVVHGPKPLDHAFDLTLVVKRHLAFAIHELEGIALQD
jgi:hypothetical protein